MRSAETTVVALVGWFFISVRQRVTPRHMPGRMNATYRLPAQADGSPPASASTT